MSDDQKPPVFHVDKLQIADLSTGETRAIVPQTEFKFAAPFTHATNFTISPLSFGSMRFTGFLDPATIADFTALESKRVVIVLFEPGFEKWLRRRAWRYWGKIKMRFRL